jgi:hypothetical protein
VQQNAHIELSPLGPDGQPDRQAAQQLRVDLQRITESCEWRHHPAEPGSKSGHLVDVTTLVVAVLSSRAAAGLIAVLGTYLKRNGGSAVMKRSDGSEITLTSGNLAQLQPTLDQWLSIDRVRG